MTRHHDEPANSVATLLDYYIAGEQVDLHSVQRAWVTLLDAYHEQLDPTLNGRHAIEQFRPRGRLKPDPDSDDAEDCPACSDVDGLCRFHTGEAAGTDATLRDAAKSLAVFRHDPEQLDGLLQQNEHNKQVTANHQLQQHVRSVRFDSHQQIEQWAEDLTVEVTGQLPDRASFGGDYRGIYVGPERTLVQRGGRVEVVIDQRARTIWFRPGYPTA